MGKRSAITPANGENSRIGRNCSPVVMPRAAGAAGELEDQPVLGDALHPGAGVGDDTAGGEQPVVADPQGAERRAQALRCQPLEERGGRAQQVALLGGELARRWASQASRRRRSSARTARPWSVSSTRTWRPSVACGRRAAYPLLEPGRTVRVIDGGWTFSCAASSPTVRSPYRSSVPRALQRRDAQRVVGLAARCAAGARAASTENRSSTGESGVGAGGLLRRWACRLA